MMVAHMDRKEGSGKIHPHKFALWIALASICMLFGGFMSAYMVRQAGGNWLEFTLPWFFVASTVVIVASSVSAHFCVLNFRKGKKRPYKFLLIATLLLGLAFIFLQYRGWLMLQQMGIDIKGNPSGSFVYVITGVHVAHVVGGLAAWCVAIIHGFSLPFKPSKRRINRLEITAQYWHFVDLLWVVLFLFLTYYR